jgi:hypothetical protein
MPSFRQGIPENAGSGPYRPMDTLSNMACRRLALTSIAFALCMLVAVAVPASAGASTPGCAPTCGGATPSVQSPAHPLPEPCMRNASCGGGAALGLGSVAGLAMLAAAVPVIGLALLQARRRPNFLRPLLGRVPTGGLFRPPRPLLDV